MENTIILNSGAEIDVIMQDNVTLDIDCSLRYIKSGEQEIAAYVNNVAKPELNSVITSAQSQMSNAITQGISDAALAAQTSAAQTISESITNVENTVSAYVVANITPQFTAAAESFNTTAASKTSELTALAQAASADASAAASSATLASTKAVDAQTAATAAVAAQQAVNSSISTLTADVASKANITADNFSAIGKSALAGFAMPSNTYDDLTLGASNSTYTAPADGYFSLIKLSTAANQYLGMYCLKDGETTLAVNTHEYGVNCWTPTSGGCNGLLPIKKGRICAINYSLGGATEYFRFIYAKGSEWEKE